MLLGFIHRKKGKFNAQFESMTMKNTDHINSNINFTFNSFIQILLEKKIVMQSIAKAVNCKIKVLKSNNFDYSIDESI